MFTEEQKNQFDPILAWMHQILTLNYYYRWKIIDFGEQLSKRSREFIMAETTALRSMDDELVLKLCALDDDSSEFSFRAAAKQLRKTTSLSQAENKRLNVRLKKFRDSLTSLKTKARNKRIAHANQRALPVLDDLPPSGHHDTPIQHALALCDLLYGEAMRFTFRLGSQEPELDLRERFEAD